MQEPSAPPQYPPTAYPPPPVPMPWAGPPFMVPPGIRMPSSIVMARAGHVMIMLGSVLVGVGVIILAFSLGRVTVSNFQVSGGPGPGSVSFAVDASGYAAGLLLGGLGIMFRGIGHLLSKWH